MKGLMILARTVFCAVLGFSVAMILTEIFSVNAKLDVLLSQGQHAFIAPGHGIPDLLLIVFLTVMGAFTGYLGIEKEKHGRR